MSGFALLALTLATAQLPPPEPPNFRIEPFTPENVQRYEAAGYELVGSRSAGDYWLYRAAQEANLPVVAYLMAKGWSADTPLLSGDWRPLSLVVHASSLGGDRVSVARLLLDAGADVRVRAPGGRPLLHLLAVFGDPALARFLVERGAEREARGPEGLTPLLYAFEPVRPTLGMGWMRKDDNGAMIRTLIDLGCDPLAQGQRYVTPLHIAAYLGRLDYLEAMVARVTYADVRTSEHRTPLHVAVLRPDNAAAVRMLLQLGSQSRARDANGMTPLDIARDKASRDPRFAEMERVLSAAP
jgi:hypothetical protein